MILSDPGIAADVAANVQDGSLSYSGALTIFEDAAVGGMTASKLSSLQAFASELNVAGGVSASPYVQQITDDVVFENSANSTWNGGAATATPLGDISSTSITDPGRRTDRRMVSRHEPSELEPRIGRRSKSQCDLPKFNAAALRSDRGSDHSRRQSGQSRRLLFLSIAGRGRAHGPSCDREHDLEQREWNLWRPLFRRWSAGLRDRQLRTAGYERRPMGERLDA